MRRKLVLCLLCMMFILNGCQQDGDNFIEYDSDEITKADNIAEADNPVKADDTSATDNPIETDDVTATGDISEGILRKEVFALVSSAENSSTDYAEQYQYIEGIGDGRGYTAGIIGFTSGTGDLLDVVNRYTELKPGNELEKYISALQKVNGTDSHEGLGDAFVADWKTAAQSEEMIQAQNDILNEQYMCPAIAYAKEDGLSPLGQYIYYDALVVHGSGDSIDCFEAIRDAALAKAAAPSDGGSEYDYLTAFLDARIPVMQMEDAHSDLSRIDTQRKFLGESNYNLDLPLEWNMYGDFFILDDNRMKTLR